MIKNCFQPVGLCEGHPFFELALHNHKQRSNPESEWKRKTIAPSAINGKKRRFVQNPLKYLLKDIEELTNKNTSWYGKSSRFHSA